MILKLFLNTQMIWMKFIKELKNTTQIKNIEYTRFDCIIIDMLINWISFRVES